MTEQDIRLGLDLGIGSLGWALIDFVNQKIIDGGVILWDVPQRDKDKKSLCAIRREARSTRRNIHRTANRKKHALILMKEFNFVPADVNADWLQTKKGEKQPFLLRIDALERPLSGRELAQMLYLIVGSRGYINHGQGDDNKNEDEGKVLSAIANNKKLLEKEGVQLFSQALLESNKAPGNDSQGRWKNRAKDYSNCLSKEMIEHDLDVIFKSQKFLANDLIKDEFIERFNEILWFEQINENYDKRVYDTVGSCVYFTKEKLKRAAASSYSNELCCAWEKLTHLRIKPYEGKEECLTLEQKHKFIDIMFSKKVIKNNNHCAVKYSTIRKELGLGSRSTFKGITGKEEDKEVFTPKGFRKLRESLSEDVFCFLVDNKLRDDASELAKSHIRTDNLGSEEQKCDDLKFQKNASLVDCVIEALTYSSNKLTYASKIGELNLPSNVKEEVLRLPFNSKIFKGYCSRSHTALEMLISCFNDGEQFTSLYDAEDASGLADKRTTSVFIKGCSLPAYTDQIDPSCKNPVVLRCMSSLQKCVNAVIAKHGVPDSIHIELARELKKSKHEDKIITKNNKDRNALKKSVLESAAKELGVPEDEISGSLVQMLIYGEQQGWKDLISGETINFNDLCHSPWEYEIDHILPLSKSCDNSQNNKHLVTVKTNRDKGNRTPYEYFCEKYDESKWIEFKNRVLNEIKIPSKKKDNLLCDDFKDRENAFIQRNLNDTRYASRLAKSYLENYLQFDDDGKQHVFCNSGAATSLLRSSWGLKKDREADNRHHFIDACVIASCIPANVKMVGTVKKGLEKPINKEAAERHKELYKSMLRSTAPWQDFADDVDGWMNSIYAVRRPNHKVTGEMFKQTLYSFEGLNKYDKAIVHYQNEGKKCFDVTGNFVLKSDGKTLINRSEQAFIRLWWDPSFTKNKGKYLVEVVFKSDLGDIKNKTYVPKFIPKANETTNRNLWKPVPERAKERPPIVIFPGDCLDIGGIYARYVSTGIADGKVKLKSMISNLPVDNVASFKNWGVTSYVRVVNEDILGECFR